MNRTILAFLITVALTGAAQACGWKNFSASAKTVIEAQDSPTLPPVAQQTDRSQHGSRVTDSGKLDRLSDIEPNPLNLAAYTIMALTHKVKTFLTANSIQENCLTTAVYFEARSESQLGQLAVATVILNRVKASNFSSTICGVVYKGSNRLNACQFSFACDGKPDIVDDGRAWKLATEVTVLALADDNTKVGPLQILATATNYHADYVDPVWSKSLNRLTKIGRHIFYSRTSLVGTKGARKNYI